jgi:hypothetical protein
MLPLRGPFVGSTKVSRNSASMENCPTVIDLQPLGGRRSRLLQCGSSRGGCSLRFTRRNCLLPRSDNRPPALSQEVVANSENGSVCPMQPLVMQHELRQADAGSRRWCLLLTRSEP